MNLLDELQPPGRPPAELDLNDPRVASLLADLPGNILKSHGRTFTRMRFVRFTDPEMGRKWASELGQQITSAADLDKQSLDFKATPSIDGGPFKGLYLTQTGLITLGCASASPAHPSFQEGLLNEETFKVFDGRGQQYLGDRAKDWETDLYEQNLHALVLVAFNEVSRQQAEKFLEDWIDKPGIERAGADGRATPAEYGGKLYDEGGIKGRREVEHFGYRDGVSQLRFLPATDSSQASALFPLNQVLLELPAGARPAGSPSNFGSFLVFRKIEQNVPAFHAGAETVAKLLRKNPGPSGLEGAYAWLVGRFRDGSPLAKYDRPTKDPTDDFDYSADRGPGSDRRCPFHTHVRKMNPRGDFDPHGQSINPSARLPVRRSVPYGERELLDVDERILAVDHPPAADTKVGLLFLAFVSSIETQFEHIVEIWANQSGFPWRSAQTDVLIGPSEKGKISVPGPTGTGSKEIPRALITRGGAYLIAMPRSFFAAMAAGRLP